MPKCTKCDNNFKYMQILWSSWYEPITCKSCGTKHYVKLSTKIIYWILLLLMLIAINFNFFDFAGKVCSILLGILMAIIIIAVMPFLVKLNTKKGDYKKGDK
jgi:CXXC-20-CXXC protein